MRDLPGNDGSIQSFSRITHSTGGPLVRHWVEHFYGATALANLLLKLQVMLAPANHGSSLAVLGNDRVGRIQAWFNGVDPGQRVLDWLSLGSVGQWQLNGNSLSYDYSTHGFYPFVLTGQGIDRKFYDFLNNYHTEPGSDGVVRVTARPVSGFTYFCACEYCSEGKALSEVLVPSQTTYVDICLRRNVDVNVFQFAWGGCETREFQGGETSGAN